MGMKTKILRFRVDSGTENLLKSRAGAERKSLSETIRTLILKSLESNPPSVPAIDPESVKKAVEAAIQASDLGTLRAGIRDLGQVLSETRAAGDGATAGYPWTRDQVRHLVYTTARLDRFFTAYNADWGRNDANVGTRARVASEAGERAVEKFGLKEDNHGR